MHSKRVNLVGEGDRLEELARRGTREEGGGLSGCDRESGHRRVELAAAKFAAQLVRSDGLAGTDVKPADMLVVADCGQNVQIGSPYDALDGCSVYAGADLEAGGRLGAGFILLKGWTVGRGAVAVGGAWAREFVDHEFFFEPASGEELWTSLVWEGDGADDVRVLEGVEAFTGVGVPDFAVREKLARGCGRGIA